jgi:hypothetical protein
MAKSIQPSSLNKLPVLGPPRLEWSAALRKAERVLPGSVGSDPSLDSSHLRE